MRVADLMPQLAYSLACAALVGCSSPNGSIPGNAASGNSTGEGSGSSSPVSDASVQHTNRPADAGKESAAPSPDASAKDITCLLMSGDACTACCATNHPVGEPVYNNVINDCTCGPPIGMQGACQTQCAQTDCSSDSDAGSSVTGDPCDLCEENSLDVGGACLTALNTDCEPLADCALYSNCVNLCGTLEEQDAGATSTKDLACALLSGDGCPDCCATNHPVGEPVYDDVVNDCTCGPPNGTLGVCQTQCAQTDCSSDPDAGSSVTGDPCDLCEQQSLTDGGCVAPLNTACQPVPDCVLYASCLNLCP
jgi:hypothetical protein